MVDTKGPQRGSLQYLSLSHVCRDPYNHSSELAGYAYYAELLIEVAEQMRISRYWDKLFETMFADLGFCVQGHWRSWCSRKKLNVSSGWLITSCIDELEMAIKRLLH